MQALNFSQKWHARNSSILDYFQAVKKDWRQAAYRLLPLLPNPSLRTKLSRIWSLTKPKTPTFSLDETIRLDLSQLCSKGIVTGMPSIDPVQLIDIQSYFKSQKCHDPYRPHLGEFIWDSPPSIECNMGMYTAEQILNAPHIMNLFNHPKLLQLAEAYIGCKPTLDNLGCWWSYDGRNLAKGTQKFHRDFDSIGGFKVFFYLSDVEIEDGPHEYVIGSHRRNELTMSNGIPDDILWAHYDPDLNLKVTGLAGTSFIADTYGIHRGQLPVRGRRLLLSAQYNINISPHGPRQPFYPSKSSKFDPYINRIYLG